jgi:hypothetical protein
MPQESSKDLAAIAALELSNALQSPSPAAPFSHIGTAQLQALRQLSKILSAALPSTTTHHAPPMSQASSQFRSTVPPAPVPLLGSPIQALPAPTMPGQSPRLARYPYQMVSPRQAPSPKVAPIVNPVHVASPRVNHTLPRNSVIPLTLYPAAANAPYVHQGMAEVNLFDNFEEEHMETPSLRRYNTRARAHQHSANQAQHLAPHVFLPITFTNTQDFHASPKQAINHIPMANAVINQNTGNSLEYRQLIQDENTFPV